MLSREPGIEAVWATGERVVRRLEAEVSSFSDSC